MASHFYIMLKALCMSSLHNLFNQIGCMKIDISVDCNEASTLGRQHTLAVPFPTNIAVYVDVMTRKQLPHYKAFVSTI